MDSKIIFSFLATVITFHSYKRDYWLAKLLEGYNLIAVSGSHGNMIKVIDIIYCIYDTLPQNYVSLLTLYNHNFYEHDVKIAS